MNYVTGYEELKNIASSELLKRCESEEYTGDYKRECARILLERGDMTEEKFAQLTEKEEDKYQPPHKRAVPKTLEECYKSDSVSDAIWNFSKGVEKAGVILLVIIILAGLAVSLVDCYVMKEVSGEDFNAGNFLANLALWGMYAFIEYWALGFVSKLLAGLASIVQSNRITSNVALYMSKERE